MQNVDPFTGLRHVLPIVRRRVVEADQLQYLVVFCGDYCVQLLPKRNKAWFVPQVFDISVAQVEAVVEPYRVKIISGGNLCRLYVFIP
jgi:hypothetical protein